MLIQSGCEGARPNILVFTSRLSSRNEELKEKGVLIYWIGAYMKEIETIEVAFQLLESVDFIPERFNICNFMVHSSFKAR